MSEERFELDFIIYQYENGETVTIQEAVATLCESDKSEAPMNDWEINFINDIGRRMDLIGAFNFSQKQCNAIQRIYKARYVDKTEDEKRR